MHGLKRGLLWFGGKSRPLQVTSPIVWPFHFDITELKLVFFSDPCNLRRSDRCRQLFLLFLIRTRSKWAGNCRSGPSTLQLLHQESWEKPVFTVRDLSKTFPTKIAKLTISPTDFPSKFPNWNTCFELVNLKNLWLNYFDGTITGDMASRQKYPWKIIYK